MPRDQQPLAPRRLAPLPSPLLLLNRLLPLPLSRSVLCMSRCVRRFFCRTLVPGEFASGELESLEIIEGKDLTVRKRRLLDGRARVAWGDFGARRRGL